MEVEIMLFQSQNPPIINRSYLNHLTKTKNTDNNPSGTATIPREAAESLRLLEPNLRTDSERPSCQMGIGKQRNEIVRAIIKRGIRHGTKTDFLLPFSTRKYRS